MADLVHLVMEWIEGNLDKKDLIFGIPVYWYERIGVLMGGISLLILSDKKVYPFSFLKRFDGRYKKQQKDFLCINDQLVNELNIKRTFNFHALLSNKPYAISSLLFTINLMAVVDLIQIPSSMNGFGALALVFVALFIFISLFLGQIFLFISVPLQALSPVSKLRVNLGVFVGIVGVIFTLISS